MRNLIVCVALLWTSLSAFAYNGIDRGNGTDYLEMEDTGAWFTGAKNTIRYCIDAAPDFPLGEPVIDRSILAAFRAWKDYDAEKRLGADIPFQGRKVDSCADADLKFHFVEKFSGPRVRIAYAERTFYDGRKGWGKGDIWIARDGWGRILPGIPDWTRGYRFRAVLVHELGHVFGVPHIEETIMAADLALTLYLPEVDLLKIDGHRRLVRSEDVLPGVLALPEEPAKNGYRACEDESAELFQILTGRSPVGTVRADFRALPAAILHVSDDADSFTFNLEFAPGAADSASSYVAELFFISWTYKGLFQGKSFGKHFSGSHYGQLKTKGGDILPLVWEENMRSKIQRGSVIYKLTGDVLKWLSPKGPRLLFTTSYAQTTESYGKQSALSDETSCR